MRERVQRATRSVLDQLIAGSDEGGITRRAPSRCWATDSSLLGEMVDALARDGAAVFGLIDRVVEGGHDPRRFATDLLSASATWSSAVPDA